MGAYSVELEVAGPLAMFTRPDTGGTPTSYPIPTWSAAKGLFESIMRFGSGEAWIRPTRVEICRRIGEPGGEVRFQRYTTNYGGPLRKGNQIARGASLQLIANVLANVCYRLHGEVVGTHRSTREGKNCNNPRHELQNRFDRGLLQGRAYRTPSLGWSEFTASYWGPFRDGQDGRPLVTEIDDQISLEIPSLLRRIFATPVNRSSGGRYAPRFDHNVSVERGVLVFPSIEDPANAD